MGLLEDNPERFFDLSGEKKYKKEFASLQKARRSLPICIILSLFHRKLGTNRKALHKQYYAQFKRSKRNYGIDDIYPWFLKDGVLVCAIYSRSPIDISDIRVFTSSGTINNFKLNAN